MERSYILFLVMATPVTKLVKTHRAECLKFMYLIICKLYFNFFKYRKEKHSYRPSLQRPIHSINYLL